MADDDKKIKVAKDGPYLVGGAIPLDEQEYVLNAKEYALDYKEVKKYPLEDNYCLCRCGKTKNQPFCDGAHIAEGFDGTETAGHRTYNEMAKFIVGVQMDLLDAEDYCMEARFCDTKSGTWHLVECAENADAVDIVKHQCTYCPSGRLTMVTKSGERIEPTLDKSISVLKDPIAAERGPLWVKGGIEIEDANGITYEVRNRVTLCCCGRSKNKPFCDGAHIYGDDKDTEA